MWRKTSFDKYRQKLMKKQSLQSYLAKKKNTHTHIAIMKAIGIVNVLVGYNNVHTQEKD